MKTNLSTAARAMLDEVPEITLYFWAITIPPQSGKPPPIF